MEIIALFLRMGYTRDEAAIRATRQISLAVLGCTATLLFAFVPLLSLPGNAGKFIRSMPLAVVFTVRSEEHTSELQSLMRISYAVFCLKTKKPKHHITYNSPLKI